MEIPNDSKKCSLCDQTKPLQDFYSKGSRTDSACKQCQKQKKKAKYVVGKTKNVVTGLKDFLELSMACFRKRVLEETKKLDEVIERCQQNSKL